jgi:hypothetical protein
MKKINITDEQHERLKSYSFHNKMTMKDALATAIDLLMVNTTSSKVVNTTNTKVLNTTDELDFTDREAQQLIDPSLLEKFGI